MISISEIFAPLNKKSNWKIPSKSNVYLLIWLVTKVLRTIFTLLVTKVFFLCTTFTWLVTKCFVHYIYLTCYQVVCVLHLPGLLKSFEHYIYFSSYKFFIHDINKSRTTFYKDFSLSCALRRVDTVRSFKKL